VVNVTPQPLYPWGKTAVFEAASDPVRIIWKREKTLVVAVTR